MDQEGAWSFLCKVRYRLSFGDYWQGQIPKTGFPDEQEKFPIIFTAQVAGLNSRI